MNMDHFKFTKAFIVDQNESILLKNNFLTPWHW